MFLRLAHVDEPGSPGLPVGRRFDRAAALDAIVGAADGGMLEGRLTVWAGPTPVILDCAHNGQAAEALADELPALVGDRPVTLVVGLLGDKSVDEVLAPLIAVATAVVVTEPTNPRALQAGRLASKVSSLRGEVDVAVEQAPSVALATARRMAGEGGAVVVAGSNYLIADLVDAPSGDHGESSGRETPSRVAKRRASF
jgi:dihydrofolate synthase/folylpolyglutamate synthase